MRFFHSPAGGDANKGREREIGPSCRTPWLDPLPLFSAVSKRCIQQTSRARETCVLAFSCDRDIPDLVFDGAAKRPEEINAKYIFNVPPSMSLPREECITRRYTCFIKGGKYNVHAVSWNGVGLPTCWWITSETPAPPQTSYKVS